MAAEKFEIEVYVLEVGENFVGMIHLGGMYLRGSAAPTRAGAVASVLGALSQNSGHDNSDMALELLVTGQGLSDLLGSNSPELEGGSS